MHSAHFIPSSPVCRRLTQVSLAIAIASTASLATALPQTGSLVSRSAGVVHLDDLFPVSSQHTVDLEGLPDFGPGNWNRFDEGVTITTHDDSSRIRLSPSFGSKVLAETKYPGTPNNPPFAGCTKNQMIRIYFDEPQDLVTLRVGYLQGQEDYVRVCGFGVFGEMTGGGPFDVFVGGGPQVVTVVKQVGGPLLPEIKIRGVEITPVMPAGAQDINDQIAVDDITFQTCPLDLNGDGTVDLDDALLVFGLVKLNDSLGMAIYYKPFDVDDNGVVDIFDAWTVYFNRGDC